MRTLDARMLFVVALLWGCKPKLKHEYYKDGRLLSEFEMADTIPHGKYRFYYNSGGVFCEGNHVQGKKSGIERCYHENGNLKKISEWNDGRLNGYVKKYSETGTLLFTSFYINDRQTGVEEWYYHNGHRSERTTFDSLGDVIHSMKWDTVGTKLYSRVIPVAKVSRNSLRVNQEALVLVYFGYKLSGKLSIEHSDLKNAIVQMSTDSVKNTFLFRLRFSEPGNYDFTIRPKHIRFTDTLTADGAIKRVQFVVRTSVGI